MSDKIKQILALSAEILENGTVEDQMELSIRLTELFSTVDQTKEVLH